MGMLDYFDDYLETDEFKKEPFRQIISQQDILFLKQKIYDSIIRGKIRSISSILALYLIDLPTFKFLMKDFKNLKFKGDEIILKIGKREIKLDPDGLTWEEMIETAQTIISHREHNRKTLKDLKKIFKDENDVVYNKKFDSYDIYYRDIYQLTIEAPFSKSRPLESPLIVDPDFERKYILSLGLNPETHRVLFGKKGVSRRVQRKGKYYLGGWDSEIDRAIQRKTLIQNREHNLDLLNRLRKLSVVDSLNVRYNKQYDRYDFYLAEEPEVGKFVFSDGGSRLNIPSEPIPDKNDPEFTKKYLNHLGFDPNIHRLGLMKNGNILVYLKQKKPF